MLAAVDIGSLTVRMLLGEVADGRVVPQTYRRAVTRLGAGLDQDKGLLPETREQTLHALTDFVETLRQQQVSGIIVVGTEALRRSGGGAQFVAEIEQKCGLKVEIIDGCREAQLTARGVMAALDPQPACCLIVDLGGGSTEFALVKSGRLIWRTSLPLGVVRLAQEPVDSLDRTISGLLETVLRELALTGHLAMVQAPDCELVGTAGTVTTLAAIDLQMSSYDWRRINNQVLSRQAIDRLRRLLCTATPAELEALPGLEPGREDLIVPGVHIVEKILEVFGRDALRVSDFGVMEGALLELAERHSD